MYKNSHVNAKKKKRIMSGEHISKHIITVLMEETDGRQKIVNSEEGRRVYSTAGKPSLWSRAPPSRPGRMEVLRKARVG